MHLKRTRLAATTLAISILTLMATASETQAFDRNYAFCGSGRCIRGVGTARLVDVHGTFIGQAIVMIDLVYTYVVVDLGFPATWISAKVTEINVYYGRFRIRIDSPYFDFETFVTVGIPGFMTLHWTQSWEEFSFVGFASFYNKIEHIP